MKLETLLLDCVLEHGRIVAVISYFIKYCLIAFSSTSNPFQRDQIPRAFITIGQNDIMPGLLDQTQTSVSSSKEAPSTAFKHLQIKGLHPTFAAEATGVDLANASEEEFQEILAAMAKVCCTPSHPP